MQPIRSNSPDLALGSPEETAARNGFACLFSSSDEYEAALIRERRAAGRYGKRNPWPMIAFWACSLAAAGMVLLATV